MLWKRYVIFFYVTFMWWHVMFNLIDVMLFFFILCMFIWVTFFYNHSLRMYRNDEKVAQEHSLKFPKVFPQQLLRRPEQAANQPPDSATPIRPQGGSPEGEGSSMIQETVIHCPACSSRQPPRRAACVHCSEFEIFEPCCWASTENALFFHIMHAHLSNFPIQPFLGCERTFTENA